MVGAARFLVSDVPLVILIAGFYLLRDTIMVTIAWVALLIFSAVLVARTFHHMKVIKHFMTDALEHDDLARLRAAASRIFFDTRTFTYSHCNGQLLLIGIPYACVAAYLGMNWWAVPILLLSRLWFVTSRQLNPPLAIFLSASKIDQIKLCGDTQRRIFPLRIINFLNIETIEAARGRRDQIKLVALDGNRLIRSEGWEAWIENILVSIPLIIMDVRELTPSLETEIGIVNRMKLHWKFVAVHDARTSIEEVAAALFGPGSLARGQASWLSAEDLPKTMVHSIALQRQLPSMEHPAALMLVPPDHDYKEWNYLWPDDSA